jgi:hypothetical protein
MNDRRTVSNPTIASRQGCQSARPRPSVFLLLVKAFECFSFCLLVPLTVVLWSVVPWFPNPWLLTDMEEFENRTPADLIGKGETGRLWASLFYLRSGMPD